VLGRAERGRGVSPCNSLVAHPTSLPQQIWG
jgi:hypothetical protein